MKIIIFGAGHFGKRFLGECNEDEEIIAFADNDSIKKNKMFCGHKVINPESISQYDYDKVVIAIDDNFRYDGAHLRANEMLNQLHGYGIPNSKIQLISFLRNENDKMRVEFIKGFSSIVYERGIQGATAECGVFRGHYAAYINKYFPDRKLYLFDTFGSGFDQRQIDREKHMNPESFACRDLINWSVYADSEISKIRCPNQEQVIIKQGYVPESFRGLEDEVFSFVNLDMDLYEPQLAALRFFSPRMSKGGVILVHDYFDKVNFIGVKPAVEDFSMEYEITSVPIGDNSSIVVIPNNSNNINNK